MTHKKTSLKEESYIKIYDLVTKNTIKPGDVINLSDLEKYLKISRAPIRDALIELCNEHVFKGLPRYGYELIKLKQKDLTEMLNYRLVLECGFLEKNWKDVVNSKPEVLDYLLEHTKELSNTSAISEWQNNLTFHIGLFKLHNNSHALISLEQTMKRMTRFFIQNYWEGWEEISKEVLSEQHENIIYAIKDKNKAKALKCLHNDIGGFKR